MLLTKEIRQRLKNAITSQKISNYKIAKELNISATTLSNYLTGKVKKADNTKIEAICRLLGISLHWLVTGQDMVKLSGSIKQTSSESVDLKEVIKQIFIMLQSKDDQYLTIHQDVDRLQREFAELKKAINKISKK